MCIFPTSGYLTLQTEAQLVLQPQQVASNMSELLLNSKLFFVVKCDTFHAAIWVLDSEESCIEPCKKPQPLRRYLTEYSVFTGNKSL